MNKIERYSNILLLSKQIKKELNYYFRRITKRRKEK
jgi:hypothetical protein